MPAQVVTAAAHQVTLREKRFQSFKWEDVSIIIRAVPPQADTEVIAVACTVLIDDSGRGIKPVRSLVREQQVMPHLQAITIFQYVISTRMLESL
jgi:hypothetical protein